MTNLALSADLVMADRFLSRLTGGTAVTFQTFTDRKGKESDPGSSSNPRIMHGGLQQHAEALQALNQRGAGVFVMVNAGDGKGRRAANVTQVRALFADLDGVPLAPVLAVELKPHLVVESSPGRYHAYWFVADCSLDKFTSAQSAIARKFESDPSVKDLPRVMRLPGFWHQKSEPFQTHIYCEHDAAPYHLVEVERGLGLCPMPTMRAPRSASSTAPASRATVPAGNPTILPSGTRDNTLMSLAGGMRRRGMTTQSIYAALVEENNLRCDPPLDDEEVRRIANSVSRYDSDANASQPQYSRRDLQLKIDATDDFDELTGEIARLVAVCDLKDSERHSLLKFIASKAKVTVASLKEDAKLYDPVNASRDTDHLKAAREVIKAFGNCNLLDASGYVWRWRGDGVWRRMSDREIKQKIHDVSGSSELTSSVVGSILDMVKTETHRTSQRFDEDPQAINCANGELSYADGRWTLKPHDRDNYRTAMIPVSFDAKARAPRFERFLQEIFQGDVDSADKAAVVIEALGYTLIPSCHLEKFFLLIGGGANGKSVLLRVVADLVGRDHVCAVQPNQFDNRFQRGHLQGRLANIITEIAEGAEIADAQLKSLVSGEMTTAEHKHRDPFDFQPYAKHYFGTNHLPHTRDFSEALFRRAVVLTFNRKFEGKERDVHLADKLKCELPGILNMALAGLQRLIENRAFTECRSSAQAASQWRLEADQVAQFVADECDSGTHCRSTSAALFKAYQGWADSAGVKRTLNRNNFSNRLIKNGFSADRGTGGTRMFAGVQPKSDYLGDGVSNFNAYARRHG